MDILHARVHSMNNIIEIKNTLHLAEFYQQSLRKIGENTVHIFPVFSRISRQIRYNTGTRIF